MAKASGLSTWGLVITVFAVLAVDRGAQAAGIYPSHPGLSEDFYNSRCPSIYFRVWNAVFQDLQNNKNLPAQLIRLFFHDCFVRGCDSSVLIESTPGNLAEMNARPNNNSIKGMDTIEKAKLRLEQDCPGVVSCADILALASQNVLLMTSGLYYPVQLGRRDGTVSTAAEANVELPGPFANFTTLVSMFQAKGLSAADMVTLSGAHTIGKTHCNLLWRRLYAFSPTVATDPALDPTFAANLKVICPQSDPQSRTEVLLDATEGGNSFDSNYYDNVIAGKTTFVSDTAIITNPAALSLAQEFGASRFFPFFVEFGVSMVKMGQIGVLTGTAGVIRTVCSRV